MEKGFETIKTGNWLSKKSLIVCDGFDDLEQPDGQYYGAGAEHC